MAFFLSGGDWQNALLFRISSQPGRITAIEPEQFYGTLTAFLHPVPTG
ncbi:hypothetical protein [Mycobacterium sp. 852002-51057_SCH5723018]|nr:hypothetical protein [Mycobacterium sp. 852002-51057_SCH5723018]